MFHGSCGGDPLCKLISLATSASNSCGDTHDHTGSGPVQGVPVGAAVPVGVELAVSEGVGVPVGTAVSVGEGGKGVDVQEGWGLRELAQHGGPVCATVALSTARVGTPEGKGSGTTGVDVGRTGGGFVVRVGLTVAVLRFSTSASLVTTPVGRAGGNTVCTPVGTAGGGGTGVTITTGIGVTGEGENGPPLNAHSASSTASNRTMPQVTYVPVVASWRPVGGFTAVPRRPL